MNFKAILFDLTDGLATITLNRPQTLNAINHQLVMDAIRAFEIAHKDDTIRAVILTGAGRGFSSGQDLLEAGQQLMNPTNTASAHLKETYHVLIELMTSLEKPVIGAINGIAAGIGFSISLNTDIRIASDKAAFTLGFSRIGMIPDGGANWILPRLIGYNRAYQMTLTSEKVDAATALQWGMINQVVPHDQLLEVATAFGRKLAAGPTLSFGLAKRAMLHGLRQTFAENLEMEAELQDIASTSDDCREGIMAFIEKRPAAYKGS